MKKVAAILHQIAKKPPFFVKKIQVLKPYSNAFVLKKNLRE